MLEIHARNTLGLAEDVEPSRSHGSHMIPDVDYQVLGSSGVSSGPGIDQDKLIVMEGAQPSNLDNTHELNRSLQHMKCN